MSGVNYRVHLKLQVGYTVEGESLRHLRPQIRPGVVEGAEGRIAALGVGEGYHDAGFAAVGGDVHVGYRDPFDARVIHFIFNEFGQFLANLLGDALEADGIHF